jgi:hypothetical protein
MLNYRFTGAECAYCVVVLNFRRGIQRPVTNFYSVVFFCVHALFHYAIGKGLLEVIVMGSSSSNSSSNSSSSSSCCECGNEPSGSIKCGEFLD